MIANLEFEPFFWTCSQSLNFRYTYFFKDCHTKTLFFSDQSAKGTEVKKIILKIYHALTQYILPMELIPKETFVQWMEILKTVVEQEMPGTLFILDAKVFKKFCLIYYQNFERKFYMTVLLCRKICQNV